MINNKINQMLEAAKTARDLAYAPYSKFKVGVSIITKKGNIYSGCNVENAAYPESICAEASAIANMILGNEGEIEEILVMGNDEILCTPCGGCRQKIREFSTAKTQIHMAKEKEILCTLTLDELLPLSFGPENLSN
ncbi:Cytidine deaminase [Candidatus Hepatincolaceae symbiont of Richtersius coronifer]